MVIISDAYELAMVFGSDRWVKYVQRLSSPTAKSSMIITLGVATFTSTSNFILPSLLLYTVCKILQGELNKLNERLRSLDSQNVESLKNLPYLHQKLCKLVSLASNIFSVYIGFTLVLSVASFILELYIIITYSTEGESVEFPVNLGFWLGVKIFVMLTALICPALVNSKVSTFHQLPSDKP